MTSYKYQCTECKSSRRLRRSALFMKPSSVYNEIQDERKRQDEKWGEQNHEPPDWLMILGEEVGEVNKAALETRFGNIKDWSEYRKELIQVAAVAVSMIESLDRKEKR